MKIALVGNPNVGKSAVFNRLTGSSVIVSNYSGTTVEFSRGFMQAGGRHIEVVDLPGAYSLDPTCKAEEVTTRGIAELTPEDVILNVVDSTNLERSLGLTLQLINLQGSMLVALNLWDEAKHTGVQIDVPALERELGVACVPIVAITGEGMSILVERLLQASIPARPFDEALRWCEIGRILGVSQKLTHRHHTFLERFGDASLRPFTGSVIAIVVLAVSFEGVRLVGEGLIGHVFDPFFSRIWGPLMLRVSVWLGGEGRVHGLLIGELEDGRIDYGTSFGLLTTGLYVPFAAVLPYVFAFYLVLSILEDSGYLPRLAVLGDRFMHKVGLHGMGMIPMLLGLGCSVPGVLSSRIMDGARERFICTTLLAIAVPCAAKAAMIIGLAGRHGPQALAMIFGTLFAVWFLLGMVLNRVMKGESPEILADIPPYRVPYFKGLLKKVWARLMAFLREAVPFVLGGVLLANLLHTFGIIDFVGKAAEPAVAGLLGLPREAVGGLVVGLLRKDVAIGMLAPLNLSFRQTVVACVVLAMYFPCVATFAVMLRELGARMMLKASIIMVMTALLVGTLINLLLRAFQG